MKISRYLTLVVTIALSSLSTYAGERIVGSRKSLPLAYDVDVIVAGGSLAGVEAACAAADNGASVLLVESFYFSNVIRQYFSSSSGLASGF